MQAADAQFCIFFKFFLFCLAIAKTYKHTLETWQKIDVDDELKKKN